MSKVADHILDNASDALLDLVNSAVKVIRECDVNPDGGGETPLPTSRSIERLRAACKLTVAAFGLIPSEDGVKEPDSDENVHLRN